MLKKPKDPTRLEQAIEELENAIIGADQESEKHTKMVASLETLYKLKNGNRPSRIEMKDLLPVLGSLTGIVVICVFEAYGHTIVSKSLGFVSKLKS